MRISEIRTAKRKQIFPPLFSFSISFAFLMKFARWPQRRMRRPFPHINAQRCWRMHTCSLNRKVSLLIVSPQTSQLVINSINYCFEKRITRELFFTSTSTGFSFRAPKDIDLENWQHRSGTTAPSPPSEPRCRPRSTQSRRRHSLNVALFR